MQKAGEGPEIDLRQTPEIRPRLRQWLTAPGNDVADFADLQARIAPTLRAYASLPFNGRSGSFFATKKQGFAGGKFGTVSRD
jgi:hypothetical protein